MVGCAPFVHELRPHPEAEMRYCAAEVEVLYAQFVPSGIAVVAQFRRAFRLRAGDGLAPRCSLPGLDVAHCVAFELHRFGLDTPRMMPHAMLHVVDAGGA